MEIAQATSRTPAATSNIQAWPWLMSPSCCGLEKIRVVVGNKCPQAIAVIRTHRGSHARPFRQRRAPAADFRQGIEHVERHESVEDVEVPEDRSIDGIDEA